MPRWRAVALLRPRKTCPPPLKRASADGWYVCSTARLMSAEQTGFRVGLSHGMSRSAHVGFRRFPAMLDTRLSPSMTRRKSATCRFFGRRDLQHAEVGATERSAPLPCIHPVAGPPDSCRTSCRPQPPAQLTLCCGEKGWRKQACRQREDACFAGGERPGPRLPRLQNVRPCRSRPF